MPAAISPRSGSRAERGACDLDQRAATAFESAGAFAEEDESVAGSGNCPAVEAGHAGACDGAATEHVAIARRAVRRDCVDDEVERPELNGGAVKGHPELLRIARVGAKCERTV